MNKNEYMKKGEILKKGWGHEIVFANNEEYCGKILNFDKKSKFSMHYHMIKDETWYVVSGKFRLTLIDTKNADYIIREISHGDIIHIKPGQPHQLEVLDDDGGSIYESSTTHRENDSYRVVKGDSQIKQMEIKT